MNKQLQMCKKQAVWQVKSLDNCSIAMCTSRSWTALKASRDKPNPQCIRGQTHRSTVSYCRTWPSRKTSRIQCRLRKRSHRLIKGSRMCLCWRSSRQAIKRVQTYLWTKSRPFWIRNFQRLPNTSPWWSPQRTSPSLSKSLMLRLWAHLKLNLYQLLYATKRKQRKRTVVLTNMLKECNSLSKPRIWLT